MSDWQAEYEKKFISAEEAANMVKSGDKVAFTSGREAYAVGLALASRMGELENVHVLVPSPTYDFGWYDEGWQEAFDITIRITTGTCQEALDARRIDFDPGTMIPFVELAGTAAADVIITEVSPPDDKGFCSFGASLWAKKRQVENAKISIAEVNDNLIRTYGDNYIHVSGIDYFTEHIPVPVQESPRKPGQLDKQIAEYVSTIIRDGDTIEIGPGLPSSLTGLGAFDGKHDLGVHCPAMDPGILDLVRRGIVTGKRKNLHPGKCIGSGFRRIQSEADIAFIDGNPMFEIRSTSYVNDIGVIASNNQMVAINGILAIDLDGQVAADSMRMRMFGGAGGQVDFSIGAMLSEGGCSIAVMQSTAVKGTASRIVSNFEPGTIVSVPWTFTDYVVTEYGIAKLLGKTRKQRAEELIAVAHPDFRTELTKEVQRRF